MVGSAVDRSQESSEDDWEDNFENLDAVPAIGPAAEQAKQKVPTNCSSSIPKATYYCFSLSCYA